MKKRYLIIDEEEYDLEKIIEYSKDLPVSIMPLTDMFLDGNVTSNIDYDEIDLNQPVYVRSGSSYRKLIVFYNEDVFRKAMKYDMLSVKTKWVTKDILNMSKIN